MGSETQVRSPSVSSWVWVGLAMLVLGITALWTLGDKTLSLDEGLTVGQSLRSLRIAVGSLRDEPNFTAYYVLIWIWSRFGDSEIWLRLPSVIFSLAAIPTCYALVAKLFSRRAGIFAAFVLATNPLVLEHAQDARPYALLLLASLLSSLCFVIACERDTRDAWLTWTLTSVVALFAHPFALFMIGAQLIWMWWFQRAIVRSRSFWLAATVTALGAIALASLMALSYDHRVDWIKPLSGNSVLDALLGIVGVTSVYLLILYLVAIVLAGVLDRSEKPRSVAFFALHLLIPVGAALAISLFKPLFVTRYLIIVVPAIAALVGTLVARIRGVYAVAVLAAFVAFVVPGYMEWRAQPDDGYDRIVEVLAERSHSGDLVLAPPMVTSGLLYYTNDRAELRDLDFSFVFTGSVPDPAMVAGRERVWQIIWRPGEWKRYELPQRFDHSETMPAHSFGLILNTDP